MNKKRNRIPTSSEEQLALDANKVAEQSIELSRKEDFSSQKGRNSSSEVSISAEKKAHGRWTEGEKKAFVEAVWLYGKNWKKVESYVGTRSGTQIRSHAQKHFLKEREKASKKSTKKKSIVTTEGNSTGKYEANINLNEKEETMRVEQLEKEYNAALSLLRSSIENQADFRQHLQKTNEEFTRIHQVSSLVLNKLKDKLRSRCMVVLETSAFEIKEIESCLLQYAKAELAKRAECSYLVQHMKAFGFNSAEDIYGKYRKLSHWIDINYQNTNPLAKFMSFGNTEIIRRYVCLLYTSPSPRD
eukprot:TRINITY_DN1517_c0_g1_i24.p1 TRINITY_DN1517_c0_g1~~TRINITY_DN1517_c0_g1_i24.p1  ORF type:complete len:301 (-),score=36.01 TRINITY_DN1517_c0_g1_i24:87-989(-)